MKIQVLLIILFLSNILFAQDKAAAIADTGKIEMPFAWKTIDDSVYSIQYPADWELATEAKTDALIILLAPAESDVDSFRENLNLIIQDLTGTNIDLNKFTQISEDQLKTMITNARLIESRRIPAPAGEFHKIIYNADQDIYRVVYEQYYWVRNNHSYILTFSAEKHRYRAYKTLAETIMNTFVIKN